MATFKIKLEDKAAFLNRMEKQSHAIGSEQIKDNKLEGYFEVTIDDLEQLEIAKTILKQSPKINTIKEMKQTLTKSQLKEMVQKELRAVLSENEEKKITLTLNEYQGSELAYKAGEWAIENFPMIAKALKNAATGDGQDIVDLGNTIVGLATVGTGAVGIGLAAAKDSIIAAAKKLKAALGGGVKEGDDALAALVDMIHAEED